MTNITNTQWKVTSGTLAAPHHRADKKPNQDAAMFRQFDGVTVIAVADGAGSLPLSHIGSHLAVEEVTNFFNADFNDETELKENIKAIIEDARSVLRNHPESDKIGCTLAVAVITDTMWAIGIVGDAFVVIQHENNELELFHTPPAGEFTNITKLLTSKLKKKDTLLASGAMPIKNIAVTSDGLEYSSLSSGKPLAGFWNTVFGWASNSVLNVSQLLSHMDKQEKIEDDTTLVVATAFPSDTYSDTSNDED